MNNPDGTPMTAAEKIATMPPDLVVRAFDTHARHWMFSVERIESLIAKINK
jgi:hypothetical protein